jgi:hypothetical protein
MIDQKVNQMRSDIAKESKTRFESIEHLETCLEVRKYIYLRLYIE